MNQSVDLTDEVDMGTLVALASNIDSLTHLEQEMAGSVTGSPWAMTMQDYVERAIEIIDAYRQMVEATNTARRKRIAKVLRRASETSGLNLGGSAGRGRANPWWHESA